MDQYTPPDARIEDIASGPIRERIRTRRLVLACTAIQAILVFFNAGTYLQSIKVGEVSALRGLCAFVGCVLLWIGVLRFARDTSRGRVLFLCAATALGLSWYGWRPVFHENYVFLFGALLGIVAGVAVKRRVSVSAGG